MAESLGQKGRGWDLNLLTSSVTTAIDRGDFVELDASGDVVKCSGASTKVIGVAETAVAARSAASKERIAVRTRGKVRVNSDGSGTAIVPGEKLILDATGQKVVHAADPGSTDPNATPDIVGIALDPSSADDTEIDVLMLIGGR